MMKQHVDHSDKTEKEASQTDEKSKAGVLKRKLAQSDLKRTHRAALNRNDHMPTG